MKRKLISLALVAILIVSSTVIFTGCGEVSYEDALATVTADIEANGDDFGDGEYCIIQDSQYLSASGDTTMQFGISTSEDGGLMICFFKDYGDSIYEYYLSEEDLFVQLDPDSESTHAYEFLLGVEGTVHGEETITGTIDAANYSAYDELTSDEFNDPNDLDNNGVVGRDGLEDNATSRLPDLLREFQAYLDDSGSGLTLANFGFANFNVEDVE
ncbi:MAG: hypothetical protein Q4D99_00605 [Bacillota bacterium]|nr:hypothetical protein [Bacillota bacterium]